ncbi:hypothetical protein MMC10_007886 [Thelotrema lepadinum]|nr:hypothetical protein [Thelotrema lepadinum]
MSSSQALAKRAADMALMPPPPPPKRIKRPSKVVDEDSYTDALSHIIARDFFPGLLELESQEEYLSALDSNDAEWIASAGQKLTEAMTPGPDGRRLRGRRGVSMTPASGLFGTASETPRGWSGKETPGTVRSTLSTTTTTTTNTDPSRPPIDTKLSLTAFQQKYVSEDSESFYKLLDTQNTKNNEKQAWMHNGNKIPEPRQIAYRKQQAKLLADAQAQEAEDGKITKSITGGPDTRPAGPESWTSRPDNALMFKPADLDDSTKTVQQKAEETSRAAPKAVVYDNTRLASSTITNKPPSSSNAPSIPPSPSLSAVKDAIAGRPRPSSSTQGDLSGSETPRVNGWAFVDSEEPEPEPEPTVAEFDYSNITFGPVNKTKNPFTIKDRSSREELHHRMVDRVARGKRKEKVDREIRTPVQATPRFGFTPRPAGAGATPAGVGGVGRKGLTPAGHRLLGKVGMGGLTPRSGLGKDTAGGATGVGSGNARVGMWEGEREKTPKRSLLRRMVTPKRTDGEKE